MPLNTRQYPFCCNPKCRHKMILQPPGNAMITEESRLTNEVYMQQCHVFSIWKKNQGQQPFCQILGTSLIREDV